MNAAAATELKSFWVILVGGGYGSFIFEGTTQEAEEMRRHKANWEGAVALKRPATPNEVEFADPSDCWNHPFFPTRQNGYRYDCACKACVTMRPDHQLTGDHRCE